jgi:hypothetical protein
MRLALFSALLVASTFVAGCATEDPGTTASAEEELTAKATGVFVATDNEASGGDFANVTTVRRANATKTKCADGKAASTCKAVGLDLSALGLTSTKESKLDAAFRSGHAIVQGTLKNVKADPSGHVTVPTIVVTAAWMSAGQNDLAASDKLYFVQHAVQNWMCLQAHPCPNINETSVNGTKTVRIEDVILDGVGASKTELKKADDAMLVGGGGLLVAGVNAKEGTGSNAVTNLEAVDFYLPYQ